jgi:tripartite-type tricarboxylate transporter receptor subunit TctC
MRYHRRSAGRQDPSETLEGTMEGIMRARPLTCCLFVLAAALAGPSLAQGQDQPIRIVFPFAAGGSGDGLVRLVGDRMQSTLKRTVIVENRTGAAGRLGTAAVRNAAPDGNTLLITPIAPVAIYQHVYKNLEYDPIRDFSPVSQLVTFDFAVAVSPKVPAKSLKELVAWVKADAARAVFASPAAGALPHFFGVMFGRAAGLELRHAPYKGSAAAVNDLVAGHIPMVFTTLSDLLQVHQAGRVRMLAVSGRKRSTFLPDMPTFREGGYDIEGSAWYGAFAPAKTPREIVDRYSTVMADAVRTPDVRERLLKFGLEPTGTTAPEMAAIQKADSERWAPAVKASGFAGQ